MASKKNAFTLFSLWNQLRNLFFNLYNDSLHRNSFFLMGSTAVLSLVGTAFWMFITRLYSSADIGLATVIISATSTITGWSLFGFGTSLVRYLPESKEKGKLIGTVFTTITVASFFIGCFFVLGLPFFSPALLFLRQDKLLLCIFLFFIPVSAINSVTDNVFIALRKTQYILMINTTISLLKLFLPIFLITAGFMGIVGAVILAVTLAMILSILAINKILKKNIQFIIDKSELKKIFHLSLSNYLATILSGLPNLVLPLLVLNKLGAKESAYFYMPSMIITVLNAIPRSVTASLLSESSYNQSTFKKLLEKAIKTTILLYLPSVLILIFFGQHVLLLFGKEFSTEGYRFLQWIAAGSIFGLVWYFSTAIFNLRQEGSKIVFLNLFGAFTSIVLSVLFISGGLVSLGRAAFITQIITACMNLLLLKVKFKPRAPKPVLA